MINTRKLGNLEVSAVGLGCMGMTHAYGAPADKTDMTKLLHAAVEIGYNFFDTAERYTGQNADGVTEYNEELVGNALKAYRHKMVVATKFGIQHDSNATLITDSRPESIRKSLEGSLKRLGTDYIDLYYQHRLDPKIPVEEVAGVMADLIREGKILHWGISEADENHIRRAHAACPITAVQNRYSIMARWHESLFPLLEELNIGFVAFSPLANGALTDCYQLGSNFEESDYRKMMPQYTKEAYEANQALTALLRELAAEKNATEAQISLAWLLEKKPYIVPIPGSRRENRIKENAEAANIKLSPTEILSLNEKLASIKMSAVYGGMRIKE